MPKFEVEQTTIEAKYNKEASSRSDTNPGPSISSDSSKQKEEVRIYIDWGEDIVCSKAALISNTVVVSAPVNYDKQRTDIIDSYVWALSAMGMEVL